MFLVRLLVDMAMDAMNDRRRILERLAISVGVTPCSGDMHQWPWSPENDPEVPAMETGLKFSMSILY